VQETTKPVQPQPTPQVSNVDPFSGLMNAISKELYSESVRLLSKPEVLVNLRALTVEEYKFLTKQLETFLSETKKETKKEVIEQKELSLSCAIDVVLKKCITNEVSVETMTMYDWIYLLLYLRCVSRPKDTTFIVRNKEEQKNVSIDIYEMLKYMEANKDRFTEEVYGEVPLKDGYSLLQMQLSRFDYRYVQQNRMMYEDTPINLLLDLMSLKAFKQNENIFLMSPEQRMEIYKRLDYDQLCEVRSNFDSNNNKFLDVVNEYIRSVDEGAEALVVSDFTICFLDF
jgi:hypothetical protein